MMKNAVVWKYLDEGSIYSSYVMWSKYSSKVCYRFIHFELWWILVRQYCQIKRTWNHILLMVYQGHCIHV